MNSKTIALLIVSVTTGLLLFLGLIALVGSCGNKSDKLTTFMSLDFTACHSAESEFPVKSAQAQYGVSCHALLGNSFYSNGTGCQVCHTNEGFIKKTKGEPIDPKSFVAHPSQPGCFTCHDPHSTGNFSLRTTADVALDGGESFSGGTGNLCAACHKAIGKASETVTQMDAGKIFAFFGPHHGPQADMFSGTNAYEYPDRSYSNSTHTSVIKDRCTVCHMALPEGRFGLSPAVGGHSFNIEGDVHHAEILNTAGCLACHKGMKQVRGEAVFDKPAASDYDNDGKVEPVQKEVEGLLAVLVNLAGTGLLKKLNPPMFKPDGGWNQVREGARSKEEVAVLYNYKFILEDRSMGIHNTIYTVQVLYDTIQALNPGFDVSKRPE